MAQTLLNILFMLSRVTRTKTVVSPMSPAQMTIEPIKESGFAARIALLGLSAILLMVDFSRAEGAVINATGSSLSAVQSAVTSASPGDTVEVPAGTAVWTNSLIINADIQLIGAGQGQTIITNNVPLSVNSGTMFFWTTSSNGICRLSGFTFAGGAVDTNHSTSSRNFYFGGNCHAMRIDHCDFTGLNQDHNLEFFGWIYGVIDHCNFTTPSTDIMVHDDTYGGQQYGDGSWADSDRWGTTNALYIESCNFVGSPPYGALDAVDGARIVFRFNYLTNSAIGSHGTESTGRSRSIRMIEAYGNTFLALSYQPWDNQPLEEAIYLRGGTATVFSNTFIGGFKYMLKCSLYRLYPNHFTAWNNISGVNPWDSNSATLFDSGICSQGIWTSGTSYVTDTNKNWTNDHWAAGYTIYDVQQGLGIPISDNNSNELWFGNYNPYGSAFVINTGENYQIHQVRAAIDQVGYGQGDLLTGDTPINTTTGTAAWPHELSDPIYEWGNVWNYSDQSSYPGVKMSSDAQPLISPGVNWLDDVVRPGYTPLVYPHPLVSGISAPVTPTLSPPSGLQAH